VVDDGSTDFTSRVAARYPWVHYIKQDNRGRSAARNAGLRESQGDYVVFLDADDRLMPEALKVGLECLDAHPECAYVSGHYKLIMADGAPLEQGQQQFVEVDGDHYFALLCGNYIGMHATVMYRRSALEAVGGFDTSIRACEDYDLYLRVARKFSVFQHNRLIAEYRQHGTNTTRDFGLMLRSALTVLGTQRKSAKENQHYEQAYKRGVEYWHKWYGDPLVAEAKGHLRQCEWGAAVRGLLTLMRYYPQGLHRLLPMSLHHWVHALPHKGGQRKMVDQGRSNWLRWVQGAQTMLRRTRKNAGLSDARKRRN
jgi:glycosyltransferase involved in cell wall biosynthesis